MKTREEVEKSNKIGEGESRYTLNVNHLLLEVLLDIRDLLQPKEEEYNRGYADCARNHITKPPEIEERTAQKLDRDVLSQFCESEKEAPELPEELRYLYDKTDDRVNSLITFLKYYEPVLKKLIR
jgi:hypothetical protein